MNLGFLSQGKIPSWPSTLFLTGVLCIQALGQGQNTKPQPNSNKKLERDFLVNILRDQKGIWTKPFHLRKEDTKWIVPIGLSMAALIATDRRTSEELVEHGENLQRVRVSKDISYAGSLYTAGGVAAIFYLGGKLRHNERAEETGLLAAEALIDSTIVSQSLKGISQRQRPPVDHSSGEFFEGGTSFPSGHAINSWTLAAIISHEYGPHHPGVRYAAYGLASAVSIARYTARKHFLSDALAGSALGYGIGLYVYRRHHDTALDDEGIHTSRLTTWRLLPDIAPRFDHRAHAYGARLSWSF